MLLLMLMATNKRDLSQILIKYEQRKGACSDPQPHITDLFSNTLTILLPKVESYFEGFVCDVVCASVV